MVKKKIDNIVKKCPTKWAKEDKLDIDLFLYWKGTLITEDEYLVLKKQLTGGR